MRRVIHTLEYGSLTSRNQPGGCASLHSVENPLLDPDSSAGRKLVYGCDGDLVAELAKGSRQHLGTFLFFSGTHFAALLDKSHPFMQDLPNYATEPMGNGPDGGLIAEARQETPEYNLKMTAFLGHSSVRCLVQHSAARGNCCLAISARRFQVSRPALDRHKAHLPDRIVKAPQAEAVCKATLKVRSHPAVSCAIYTRHCPDACEAVWKSHQEQRDACKAFVASERQHGWRALPARYIDSESSRSTMQRPSLRRLLMQVQKGIRCSSR